MSGWKENSERVLADIQHGRFGLRDSNLVGGALGKGGWERGPIGEQLVLAMKRVDIAY